jgi:hypothetical protein
MEDNSKIHFRKICEDMKRIELASGYNGGL